MLEIAWRALNIFVKLDICADGGGDGNEILRLFCVKCAAKYRIAKAIPNTHGIISAKTCQKKLFVFGCVDNGYAIWGFAQSNDLS